MRLSSLWDSIIEEVEESPLVWVKERQHVDDSVSEALSSERARMHLKRPEM